MTRLNSMDGLSPLAIIENPYTHLFLQAHVKRYSPEVSFVCDGKSFSQDLSSVPHLESGNFFFRYLAFLKLGTGDILECLLPQNFLLHSRCPNVCLQFHRRF